ERELRLQGLARRKTAWTAPKSEYSGACADGDHDACRMDHLPDDICLCTHSSHGVNAPRGFSPDAYNDMSGACADGDHAACQMTHADISAYCLCPEHRERSGIFGRRKTALIGDWREYTQFGSRFWGLRDSEGFDIGEVRRDPDGKVWWLVIDPEEGIGVEDGYASTVEEAQRLVELKAIPFPGQEPLPFDAKRKTSSKRYEVAKAVVESNQAQKIEGTTLDTTSAQALIAVYEALSADNQAKFDSIPFDKLMEFVWSKVSYLARKRANRKTANTEYEDILSRATQAGYAAMNAATPTPMVVQQHAHPFDDNSPVVKEWYVSE